MEKYKTGGLYQILIDTNFRFLYGLDGSFIRLLSHNEKIVLLEHLPESITANWIVEGSYLDNILLESSYGGWAKILTTEGKIGYIPIKCLADF